MIKNPFQGHSPLKNRHLGVTKPAFTRQQSPAPGISYHLHDEHPGFDEESPLTTPSSREIC